ncbi:hypothetical protein WJX73_008520 [Symbiochloris irregularis]|uniref:Uncharacterized protein n=1 Tax=Symbiochloris irregularis TaxID=706552 RepID=A0AAW1P0C4_9CHLO
MAPADSAKRPVGSNRLKEQTPFACNVHFRADLPEIAGAPRLLVTPLQPDKLAAFRLTSLEKDPKSFLDILSKQALFATSELGVPINLLDIERYAVPDTAPELDPEDLALLEETEKDAQHASAKPSAPQKQELSWLMRTSYISNDIKARKQQQAAEAGHLSDLLTDEIKAIEDGFAAAQQPPQHATKPGMQAMEVLPVLPDFESWTNKYVIVTFDDNPARENDLAGPGVLQSYTTRADSGKLEKWIALLMPRPGPEAEDADMPDGAERNYDWVREYKFRFDEDSQGDIHVTTCVLCLEGGCATYKPAPFRLALQKRPRVAAPRPALVTIRKRPPSQEELEERAAARQRLTKASADDDLNGDYDGSAGRRSSSPSPQLSD